MLNVSYACTLNFPLHLRTCSTKLDHHRYETTTNRNSTDVDDYYWLNIFNTLARPLMIDKGGQMGIKIRGGNCI